MKNYNKQVGLLKVFQDYALNRIKEIDEDGFIKFLFNLKEYRQLWSDSEKAMKRWDWIVNKMDRIAKSYKENCNEGKARRDVEYCQGA